MLIMKAMSQKASFLAHKHAFRFIFYKKSKCKKSLTNVIIVINNIRQWEQYDARNPKIG
jgi:hypothetical protein